MEVALQMACATYNYKLTQHTQVIILGVGTISTELAGEIWRLQHDGRLRRKSRGVHPRTFQIRFGGSKGMLSVDYKLQGRVLCIRPSMTKFDSPSLAIEIAKSFEKPTKMVLNRPMIMLLEGLGVDAKHFLDLQRSAVQETKSAAEEISSAIYMMESYGLGTSFKLGSVWNNLSRKLDLSFRTMCSDEDLFTMRILDYSVNHVIRELKHHARIPVPNSWTLPGVADVHDYLQEGEIFACVQELPDHPSLYLEGVCLITRSPVIHPGDVQMVRAIGKPPKGSPYDMEPLKNSVVFSVKGGHIKCTRTITDFHRTEIFAILPRRRRSRRRSL
jgi:RNA-dependent RNA polymerase